MSTLAKQGNRVLFIENTGVRTPKLKDLSRIKGRLKNFFKGTKGFREQIDNLYIFSPIILPFPYSKVALWINKMIMLVFIRKWMHALNFSTPLIWSFLPTALARAITKSIPHSLLVYYCADSFENSSSDARKIVPDQTIFITTADVIFATSHVLKEKCEQLNSNVHLFSGGVDFEKFFRAHPRSTKDEIVEKELRDRLKIKGPIVGYIGGIHKAMNFELIEYLAQKNPLINFVYIGPLQEDVSFLQKYNNVCFLGQKGHELLPYYIKAFNIAHIPYVCSDYTKSVYPSKINEYWSMGKQVVSSPLFEVKKFVANYPNSVVVGEDNEDYSCKICELLKESAAPAFKEQRFNQLLAIAQENSWQKKIADMGRIISSALDLKKKARKRSWAQSFNFHELRRIAIALLFFVIGWGLIFKTSFILILAEPLKYESPLRNADAVVVVASGTGEMGQSSKSYEERIFEAIKLYKQDMTDYLILFGMTKVKYSEAQLMNLIAQENGVDANKIFLEEKSWNSRDIVSSIVNILQAKGLNSVILISSPYHMLRMKKLMEKKAREGFAFEVIYHPLQNSSFYQRPPNGGITISQLQAIAFEYAALVYYFIRGDIEAN
ncbi:MAG: YdcF family protein [Oligoflexia bacterium]|nr:YdcF family protein [Oligoflexia bacterium]